MVIVPDGGAEKGLVEGGCRCGLGLGLVDPAQLRHVLCNDTL